MLFCTACINTQYVIVVAAYNYSKINSQLISGDVNSIVVGDNVSVGKVSLHV